MNEDNYKSFGKLDIAIPDDAYEAGSISTVRILIRNPFDTSVDIIDIIGPKSSNLQEADKIDAFNYSENNSKNFLKSFFNNLWGFFSGIAVSSITYGGIEIDLPKKKNELNILAEPESTIEIDTDLSSFDTVNIKAETKSQVNFKPQAEKNKIHADQVITIEPHCEAVAYFQITTSGWLFFTPSRQELSTQIRYKIDGQEKTQVVSSGFDIKPPLRSMIVGSILGAFLGNLAKNLNNAELPSIKIMAVSIGASIVMSLIATIALARKTGTQGFITVEDFFGGFVIGALIGYGGTEYFEKSVLPQPST